MTHTLHTHYGGHVHAHLHQPQLHAPFILSIDTVHHRTFVVNTYTLTCAISTLNYLPTPFIGAPIGPAVTPLPFRQAVAPAASVRVPVGKLLLVPAEAGGAG